VFASFPGLKLELLAIKFIFQKIIINKENKFLHHCFITFLQYFIITTGLFVTVTVINMKGLFGINSPKFHF